MIKKIKEGTCWCCKEKEYNDNNGEKLKLKISY